VKEPERRAIERGPRLNRHGACHGGHGARVSSRCAHRVFGAAEPIDFVAAAFQRNRRALPKIGLRDSLLKSKVLRSTLPSWKERFVGHQEFSTVKVIFQDLTLIPFAFANDVSSDLVPEIPDESFKRTNNIIVRRI
jgi:hypothetical protein